MRNKKETLPLVPLDTVRTKLAFLWLVGTGLIVTIVVVQSLLGHFGDKTQQAWGWLLPTIMPSLGMIISVLGYTAFDPELSSHVVRTSFYRIAIGLSGMYLFFIALTVLIEPFSRREPVELMSLSNLWLGPIQALVAAALGVLFVSKRKLESEKENAMTSSY